MKHIQINLKWVPEFYFILVSILWYYASVQSQADVQSQFVNFPAVIMIVIFHIQLFLNDQVLGKILAGIMAFASVYLIYYFGIRIYDMMQRGEDYFFFILETGNLVLINFIMAYLMYSKYDQNILLTQKINQSSHSEYDQQ